MNVPVNTTVTLTFGNNIQPGPGFNDIRLFNCFAGLNKTISGNVLTITPVGGLAATEEGTSVYGAHIGLWVPANAVTDTNNDTMASGFYSEFTVATPLYVVNVNPADGSSQVAVNQSIVVTFNTAIEAGPGFSNIFNGNTWVPINKTISGDTLTLTPVGTWLSDSSQFVIIPPNGVTTLNGTAMMGEWDTSFSTASSPASSGTLYVTSADPWSTATNVSTSAKITITFNQNVQAGPTFSDISVSSYNGTFTDYSGSLVTTISGNTLTINPVAGLTPSSIYTVTIPAGAVSDSAGNNLATEFNSFFATAGQTLQITAVNPPNGATDVPVNQTISVTFNTAIKPGPGFNYIRVYDYMGPLIKTISGNTLFIQPSGEWLYNDPQCWIVIPSNAVVDSSGNSLTLIFGSSFLTTGQQLSVNSTNPSAGASNVPVNQSISVTFNMAIQPGAGFGDIQVLGYNGPLYMTVSGNTLTMTPLENLPQGIMLHVFVPAGSIESSAGAPMPADYDFYITTVGS